MEIPIGPFVFDARADGPAEGELVLLLHGFPQTSWSWRQQLPALAAAGFRVVAPDQRGYSAGARPRGVVWYRAETLATDVIGMADHLGAERFHLVGHDWGAAIAWQVAARWRARLLTLTPISTPHPQAMAAALATSPAQQEMSTYLDFFRTVEAPERALLANEGAGLRAMFAGSGLQGDVEEYVRVMREPGAMTAALNWYRAVDRSFLDGMGLVTAPTMYVWSTEDIALGREAAEATAAHVTGPYRFEVLEGVSHWVPEDGADELNRLLLDHLASVR